MLRLVIVLAGFAVLSGCTSQHIMGGFYEGLRVRNDLQSTPSERIGRPEAPSYSDYQRMQK